MPTVLKSGSVAWSRHWVRSAHLLCIRQFPLFDPGHTDCRVSGQQRDVTSGWVVTAAFLRLVIVTVVSLGSMVWKGVVKKGVENAHCWCQQQYNCAMTATLHCFDSQAIVIIQPTQTYKTHEFYRVFHCSVLRSRSAAITGLSLGYPVAGVMEVLIRVFRRVRKTAGTHFYFRRFRPYAWNNWAATGRILMKFNI